MVVVLFTFCTGIFYLHRVVQPSIKKHVVTNSNNKKLEIITFNIILSKEYYTNLLLFIKYPIVIMPNCSKCGKAQSRLNKGALCKECFQEKINPSNNGSNSGSINQSRDYNNNVADDKTVFEIIKDTMYKERMWNEEMHVILKEQIDFLKKEIIVKNTLIENLMTELHERNPESSNTINNVSNEISADNDASPLQPIVNTSLINNDNDNACRNGEYLTSEIPLNRQNPLFANSQNNVYDNIIHPKRYEALNECHSSLIDDYEKDSICEWVKNKDVIREVKRPHNVINQHPENDITQKKYSRSITILGDSIVKDIQAHKLKRSLALNEKIQVKSFSGSTVDDMIDYARPTIRKEPDLIVLHVGSNDLRSKKNG